MRYFNKSEDLMVRLNQDFQRKLFKNLLSNYSRDFLSKKFKKTSAMMYHYKNCRVKTIPFKVVNQATKLLNIPHSNLEKNISKKFSAKEALRKILDKGIETRKIQLREKLSIPFGSYSLITAHGKALGLNTLLWLNKNKWIEKISKHSGILKEVRAEKDNFNIKISYQVYNRKKKGFSFYSVFLPIKIELDSPFCYFLGLLYGDGLNGARIGIVNKDKNLIEWTSNFLINYFPKNRIKSQLTLHKHAMNLSILEKKEWLKSISQEVSVYYNKDALGDFVFNIFIVNNILRRIIDDLLSNLIPLFERLNLKQKGSFLAGLFDSEGNVNMRDKTLRISQKIPLKLEVIKEILIKSNYRAKYDGSNFVIGSSKNYLSEIELFQDNILPFLKHSVKANKAKLLVDSALKTGLRKI